MGYIDDVYNMLGATEGFRDVTKNVRQYGFLAGIAISGGDARRKREEEEFQAELRNRDTELKARRANADPKEREAIIKKVDKAIKEAASKLNRDNALKVKTIKEIRNFVGDDEDIYEDLMDDVKTIKSRPIQVTREDSTNRVDYYLWSYTCQDAGNFLCSNYVGPFSELLYSKIDVEEIANVMTLDIWADDGNAGIVLKW